ncbi:MAG: hypothetical protein NTX26_01100 [Candidatus Parcubacteria bacterium]|nr:hypothetical protein [Candidatus Parcubacteria bacterium]
MLILAHSTVGLLIGTVVKNPVLSFLLAWLSHYILDFIPHSDAGYFKARGENWLKNKKVVSWIFLDAILSGTLLLILTFKNGFQPSLVSAYFGSLLPDIVDNSPFWSEALRKFPPINWEYRYIHNHFHHTLKNRKTFICGIIISYIFSAILIFLLLK